MKTDRRTLYAALSVISIMFVAQGVAHAKKPWGRWGRGGGARIRCAHALLNAPPEVLKARLSLTDDQLNRIQALRTNFLTKRIKQRSQLQLVQLQLRTLLEADLPDQGKVLTQMRKARGIRGKIQEERVKAQLKMLTVLKKEQRTLLRAQCPGWGGKGAFKGGGPWGRKRGFGPGRGWGRGGRGGRGPGGPGGGGGGGWGPGSGGW